jgi:hypothetical protein
MNITGGPGKYTQIANNFDTGDFTKKVLTASCALRDR